MQTVSKEPGIYARFALCPECEGHGYDVFESDSRGMEIERCDSCQRFGDDSAAWGALNRECADGDVWALGRQRQFNELVSMIVQYMVPMYVEVEAGEIARIALARDCIVPPAEVLTRNHAPVGDETAAYVTSMVDGNHWPEWARSWPGGPPICEKLAYGRRHDLNKRDK